MQSVRHNGRLCLTSTYLTLARVCNDLELDVNQPVMSALDTEPLFGDRVNFTLSDTVFDCVGTFNVTFTEVYNFNGASSTFECTFSVEVTDSCDEVSCTGETEVCVRSGDAASNGTCQGM